MSPIEFLFLCCILLKGSEGLYVVKLTLLDYDNPTGTCYDPQWCVRENGLHRCCDADQVSGCTGNRRCDSYFIYCLRPLGSEGQGCSDYERRISNRNRDDNNPIDATQSTVLGLENPLILRGITESSYDGVQIYIEIQDQDTQPPDDLVDILLINHSLPLGESTQRQTYNGMFGFVTMDLNITVFCTENFQVPDCTQCVTGFTGADCLEVDDCVGVNCSGNGRCMDGADSFTCNCSAGFTGELCQINIDDCVGVNCSGNGRCVDGVDSFSCGCDPGFTGVICQTKIDNCVGVNCSGNGQCVGGVTSFTCECSPGYTGLLCEVKDVQTELNSQLIIGGVAGGVSGFILLLILFTCCLVLVLFTRIHKRDTMNAKEDEGSSLDGKDLQLRDGGLIEMENNDAYAFTAHTQDNIAYGHLPSRTPGSLIATSSPCVTTEDNVAYVFTTPQVHIEDNVAYGVVHAE